MSRSAFPRRLYALFCLPATIALVGANSAADRPSDLVVAESFQDSARGVLTQLAELLLGGREAATPEALGAFLAPEAKASALIASSSRSVELPGARIQRAEAPATEATLEAQPALREFAGYFDGASSRRLSFEIVGVDLSRTERPSTVVRVELGAAHSSIEQCVAQWRIDWQRVDGEPPRLLQLKRLGEQRLRVEDLLFRDATAAVIDGPLDDRWRGGDYWHGRVDAVAGQNWMGHHGIAIGDADGDGLEDLYVAAGSGIPNQLWIHRPDGKIEDRAYASGVAWLDDTKGVLFADMDNDGDQDLLAAVGPSILIHYNDGEGRFTSVSALRAPTSAAFYSLSVADYDLDGDLDIFGARYVRQAYAVSIPEPLHDANNGPSNHLMRNDGDGRFTDVTAALGLTGNSRFSLIGAWGDYDDDGDQDLYVANDFGRNNLYRNDGSKFVDVAALAGVEDPSSGMGVSWGDYDGDGDLDLHVTNVYSAAGNRIAHQPAFQTVASSDRRAQIQRLAAGNRLFANRGDGSFDDRSDAAGIRMGRWGWGGRFTDLDSDGRLDLIVPDGFLTGPIEGDLSSDFWWRVASQAFPEAPAAGYADGWAEIGEAMAQGRSWSGNERNVAYLNTADGRFVDASWVTGLDHADDGRAVAETDWDHDGDTDLWFRNRSGPALRLMLNQRTPQRYVALLLEGRESNRDAVGASVRIATSERLLRRDVVAGDGYLSQSTRWLHFGLATGERVQRLEVRWPGAATESFTQVEVDRRYRLVQASGTLEPVSMPRPRIEAAPLELLPPPPLSALTLKEPLQLPPNFFSSIQSTPIAGRSSFVTFWTHRSLPCMEALSELSAAYPQIKSAGIDIFPLNVDEPQASADAEQRYRQYVLDRAPTSPFRTQRATEDQRALVETLVAEVTATAGELRIPTGLLIDPLGRLQVIYLGPVDGERLLQDHRRWIATRSNPAERAAFDGHWYFRTSRPYGALARELKRRGQGEAARFYLGLDHFSAPVPRSGRP